MRKYILVLCLFFCPVSSQADSYPGPFGEGNWNLGISLGGGVGSFGIGGELGHMILDGVELSFGTSFVFMEETNLVTLTPGARYILWQLDVAKPYVGGFFRRWLFSDAAFEDLSSVGLRGGLFIDAGSRAMIGIGAVYERALDCKLAPWGACAGVYPEVSISIFF